MQLACSAGQAAQQQQQQQNVLASGLVAAASSSISSSCSSVVVQQLQAAQMQQAQAATNQQRDSHWEQLDSWSRQQLGKPALQCTSNDLIVYLESSFIRQHGRQTAADGSQCPAPGTFSGAVANLSTRLQQLGRRGAWDCITGTGNPCDSMELRSFKGGYANSMQESGYQPTSAKPISESKLQQLVAQLVEEADAYQQLKPGQQQQQPWHVEALLRRDACIVQYLWDSRRRPAETGRLQALQVEVRLSASSGGQVLAQPSISKIERE
jgi:hypothetical protein